MTKRKNIYFADEKLFDKAKKYAKSIKKPNGVNWTLSQLISTLIEKELKIKSLKR